LLAPSTRPLVPPGSPVEALVESWRGMSLSSSRIPSLGASPLRRGIREGDLPPKFPLTQAQGWPYSAEFQRPGCHAILMALPARSLYPFSWRHLVMSFRLGRGRAGPLPNLGTWCSGAVAGQLPHARITPRTHTVFCWPETAVGATRVVTRSYQEGEKGAGSYGRALRSGEWSAPRFGAIHRRDASPSRTSVFRGVRVSFPPAPLPANRNLRAHCGP